MIYIGIDGGLEGGICAIDGDSKIICKYKMPIIKGARRSEYDIQEIRQILSKIKTSYGDVIVGVEKSQVTFLSGKNSCFGMGFYFGMLQGLLTGMDISYQVFRAQDWQKEILQGIAGTDTKQKSIIYCKRKYPNEDWKATSKCKKDSNGLTDACCIANYLRYKGGDVPPTFCEKRRRMKND